LFILKDDPTPKFWSFLAHFWGMVPIFALTKAVPHGFEQSCSAMSTQRLEEKAQQHDEDAELRKTGNRNPSRVHGKAYEQMPAMICDS